MTTFPKLQIQAALIAASACIEHLQGVYDVNLPAFAAAVRGVDSDSVDTKMYGDLEILWDRIICYICAHGKSCDLLFISKEEKQNGLVTIHDIKDIHNEIVYLLNQC